MIVNVSCWNTKHNKDANSNVTNMDLKSIQMRLKKENGAVILIGKEVVC